MFQIMVIQMNTYIEKAIQGLDEVTAMLCRFLPPLYDQNQVWQQYQKEQPEIIIAQCNDEGIWELLHRMMHHNHDTQIIIVDEKENITSMKRALRLHAGAYLSYAKLSDELPHVLSGARIRCQQIRQRRIERETSFKQVLFYEFSSIKNDPCYQSSIPTLLKEAPWNDFAQNGFIMAYITASQLSKKTSPLNQPWSLIEKEMKTILQKSQLDFDSCKLLPFERRAAVMLFPTTLYHMVFHICQTMPEQIQGWTLSITVSEPCTNLNSLDERFRSLINCHEAHFYRIGHIQSQEEPLPLQPLNKGNIDFHNRLYEALHLRDYREWNRLYRQVITYMEENHILPQDVRSYIVFLIHNMEGNELKKGLKIDFDFQSVVLQVWQCETFAQLDALLQEALKRIEIWLKDEESDRYGKEITDVILFVEQNWSEKITLHMLAERFNMNESYLSRMFKQQTGKNLIYFINEKKMNKAKELLSDPDMMVKEAAYALGYEDQFYFNKLFKRFFGLTPSAYRRRMMEQSRLQYTEIDGSTIH